jgi:hypothetical protein
MLKSKKSEDCLSPELTARKLTEAFGIISADVSDRIEAVLSKDGQSGGGISDCGSFGSVFNYSVMIAVAITGIGACYYNSYPAFKTLTFMLKGGNTDIKHLQEVWRMYGFNFKVSHFIKDATMNAIQAVLSGKSSDLPKWLFHIVKQICEHPHESSEKEIAAIIINEFGKAESGKAESGEASGGKARGGKAKSRRKLKNKKIMFNRKTKRQTHRK